MDNLPDKLQNIVEEVDHQIAPKLEEIEDQIVYNQAKVLKAFQDSFPNFYVFFSQYCSKLVKNFFLCLYIP